MHGCFLIVAESDLESESVCLLPEDELILQQPLQDLDYITGISLFHSLLFIFFLFWGPYNFQVYMLSVRTVYLDLPS